MMGNIPRIQSGLNFAMSVILVYSCRSHLYELGRIYGEFIFFILTFYSAFRCRYMTVPILSQAP